MLKIEYTPLFQIIKVEPYWNVNSWYKEKEERDKNIKVEPYWNVNLAASVNELVNCFN